MFFLLWFLLNKNIKQNIKYIAIILLCYYIKNQVFNKNYTNTFIL